MKLFMQPPQSIEEIKAGLETTEKGGVRQSIRNCLTVFQRDPLLSGAIAYNILTDRKDIMVNAMYAKDISKKIWTSLQRKKEAGYGSTSNADWWIRDFYDTAGGRQRDRASGTGGSNASAGMVHIK